MSDLDAKSLDDAYATQVANCYNVLIDNLIACRAGVQGAIDEDECRKSFARGIAVARDALNIAKIAMAT